MFKGLASFGVFFVIFLVVLGMIAAGAIDRQVKLVETRGELEKTQTELDQTGAALEQTDAELKQAQTDLALIAEERDEIRAAFARAQEENEQLKSAVATLQAQNEQLRAQVDPFWQAQERERLRQYGRRSNAVAAVTLGIMLALIGTPVALIVWYEGDKRGVWQRLWQR